MEPPLRALSMPVNLNAPLRWKSADADERAMLDDLQGNILDGHGRRSTRNLFLKFGTDDEGKAAGRACLARLAPMVTSAAQQLADAEKFRKYHVSGPPFVGLLLSWAGYEALGLEAKAPTPADKGAFKEGMLKRRKLLNDPPAKALEPEYRDRPHAMILIGGKPDGDDSWESAEVEQTETAILNLMGDGAAVVKTEIGRAIFRNNGPDHQGEPRFEGIEHFGYVDGRSQPLLLEEQIDRERHETDGVDVWDPAFPLSQVLVRDPGSAQDTAFGSFFVFRKLEQDVAGFKALEAEMGEDPALGGLGELMGAMLVGRFEDGTPVTLFDTDSAAGPVRNNFNYDSDTDGLKCPFHAHIRKTNPRGDVKRTFGLDDLSGDRKPIMARRGMPYGRRDRVTDPQAMAGEPVGLMFMSFQSNLADQFEFTQSSWANNEGFVNGGAGGFPSTGLDPVIGQRGPNAPVKFTHRTKWGDPTAPTKRISFDGFVTHRGGEYFFAPAKSTLSAL